MRSFILTFFLISFIYSESFSTEPGKRDPYARVIAYYQAQKASALMCAIKYPELNKSINKNIKIWEYKYQTDIDLAYKKFYENIYKSPLKKEYIKENIEAIASVEIIMMNGSLEDEDWSKNLCSEAAGDYFIKEDNFSNLKNLLPENAKNTPEQLNFEQQRYLSNPQ